MADSKEGEGNQIAGKFKVISENSQTLITWSLSIVGGSIVAIVGSSYLRPDSLYWRLPYFLFLPGWIYLALSIHKGHEISRRYIASIFTNKPQALIDIGQAINTCYDRQLVYFERALIFFAIWLVSFLLWWMIK